MDCNQGLDHRGTVGSCTEVVDEGACKLLLLPIFLCLLKSIVFQGKLPIFCVHGWRKMSPWNLNKTQYFIFQPYEKVNSTYFSWSMPWTSFSLKIFGCDTMWIDHHLSWHHHIHYVCDNCINIIIKVKHYVSDHCLINIYYLIIYTYSLYDCLCTCIYILVLQNLKKA